MDIQLMREFIALVNLKSYRKVAQQFRYRAINAQSPH